jgi:PAS domain S-box-containing protein
MDTDKFVEQDNKKCQNKTKNEQIKNEIKILKYTIDSLKNGIAISDFEDKLTYVNSSFLKMWGYDSSEEVVGRSTIEFWEQDLEAKIVKKEPQTDINGVGEVVGKRKNGSKFHVQISESRIPDDDVEKRSNNRMMSSFIDITEQKQYDRNKIELVKTIKEREILFKELRHRVKNNLQLLSSMVDMQIMRSTEHVPIEKLQEIQSIIDTMALIYSRSFEGSEILNFDLKMFISELTSGLLKFKAEEEQYIVYTIECDEVILNTDKAIPIVLIANELIFNSLKHAFSGLKKGHIIINIKKNHDSLKLTFKDDGSGLPKGFEIEKTRTLGLKIVRNLIVQLNGTLKINNKSGTEFVITIPVDGVET